MRRAALLLFAVAVFAAALVALAPATLLDAALQQAAAGRLRLAGAQGTLWKGTGWVEIRDAQGRGGIARRLAWRVRPASLVRARLAVDLELDEDGKPFPLVLSPGRIELARASAYVPAAALGLALPQLAALGLSGEVLVEVAGLALERGRMQGEATLKWRAAGSALVPVSPLGEYEVRVKAAGPGLQAVLSTLEGPLRLEGQGTWSQGAAPKYLAVARVSPPHDAALVPLLRLVAIEREPGRFELSSDRAAFAIAR